MKFSITIQQWDWVKGSIALAVVASLVGCSQPSPLHPSYDDLKREGFYVYVLPESVVAQKGWRQEITISSFDRHCRGLTAAEQHNPLYVYYLASLDRNVPRRPIFSVEVGPWSPPWGTEGPWTEIELRLKWVNGGVGQYLEGTLTNGAFVEIRFIDTFGFPVYIDSRLSLTETVSLIDQLEYVGPSPSTVVNPWDCSHYFGDQ